MIREISLAPMEGITGYVFRNAFYQTFGGVTRFYSPFISPGRDGIGITKRDRKDVLPENNAGIPLIPQILTNRAEDFLFAAERMRDWGYQEVNLNLGCPSGTVAAKHKGAGFLSEREKLEEFFDRVFARWDPALKLSVKTRIGRQTPEEFPGLLEIYNRYPISELAIHPRVQKEFYRGEVHREVFASAVRRAKMPLCYNGDLLDTEDLLRFEKDFPSVKSVMIGRGLLKNPLLAERFFAVREEGKELKASSRREKLILFHVRLLEGYGKSFQFENATLCRMKEVWDYLGDSFPDCERAVRKLKKSRTLAEYCAAADGILKNGAVGE
ncbi:MAG: tRNA dihydrouridine synthase [Stomatobaculum sp.]